MAAPTYCSQLTKHAICYVCAFLALGQSSVTHGRRPDLMNQAAPHALGTSQIPQEAMHASNDRSLEHTVRSLFSSSDTCLRHIYSEPVAAFKWMTSMDLRQKTQVNPGDPARLRAALDRYLQGQNMTLVFLGGSISAGQGAIDGKSFPYWAEEILQQGLAGKGGDSKFRVHTGAVPGTQSSYMSVCHNIHCPKEADVIIVDYTLNDPDEEVPVMDNPVRRPFERLIRKLLNYPRRPAVILIHAYKWMTHVGPNPYWKSCERDFHDLALYYGLPELSVKAGAWNLMRTGVPGYIVNRTRGNMHGQLQHAVDAELKGKVFYWDRIHPDGQTGHKFMGEITAQIVLDALASATARQVTQEEAAKTHAPIPPPMVLNNWESSSDKCFIGPNFAKAVISNESWVYKDEGSSARPKLGFISDTPGAQLKIKINTTSSTGHQELEITVELSYLKSYINMGRASVECSSGCVCQPSKMDCSTADRTSLLNLHEFRATQHDECVVTITVLAETTSGKHKVKIAGIMVSEEGGGDGVKNNMVIDMIMEGMSAGSSSTEFDMKDWTALG